MKEQEAITQEEAIKRLKESRFTIQPYNYMNQALDMAISALEKQKAKKPIELHYEEDGEKPYIKYACPNNCHISLYPVTEKNLIHQHIYCPRCGQKLDWSEI